MSFDPSVFKAYDIRGTYPEQINEELAYSIGQAYAATVKPAGEVLVGMDVRLYSGVLKENLIRGLTDAGINVIDAGLMSTDMLYFAVGNYKTAGGIQVTASHNPKEYHGFKMVKAGPVPMSLETGISEVRDYIAGGGKISSETKGTVRKIDIWDDYCRYVLGWIDIAKVKPMKVVCNANFGLSFKVFERIVKLGNLPLTLIPLNGEPDGNFPKGRPDPFIPENRKEFVEVVKKENADLGIAWDADADRIFFCAENGEFIEPYYTNTILIKSILKSNPGDKVVYDPRYTWALIDAIKEGGGVPVLWKVGHSYIKEKMREENAVFAGESSGHTYYRDYWFSDCGTIPALQIIEYLCLNNVKLSDVLKPVMDKYIISGEINSEVKDKDKIISALKEKYKDASISELDGISIEYDDYRFTVRASNTEPLLRLTLEAKSRSRMEEKRDEVLAIIRS